MFDNTNLDSAIKHAKSLNRADVAVAQAEGSSSYTCCTPEYANRKGYKILWRAK